jgi:uncharacterized protein DUF5666
MIRNSRLPFLFILSLFALLLSFSIAQGLLAQDASPPAANLVTIEGPIQSINDTVITISGINIQVNEDDPVWANLQVGDVVRVQANPVQEEDTVVIVAVVIVIIIDIDTTPEATPEMTPEATPETTPEATPEMTPEATPESTPDPDDDDDDLPITIVIEGPVQAININIITIYNINIELDENDPLLTVIQIGDVVHVEGNVVNQGNTIIVIVVNIIIINVDVVIGDDGAVWRDHGNCSNPPPPWAPAHGWHRRCDNPAPSGGGSNSGMGMGDDDDD